jgi:hypothetical protein
VSARKSAADRRLVIYTQDEGVTAEELRRSLLAVHRILVQHGGPVARLCGAMPPADEEPARSEEQHPVE